MGRILASSSAAFHSFAKGSSYRAFTSFQAWELPFEGLCLLLGSIMVAGTVAPSWCDKRAFTITSSVACASSIVAAQQSLPGWRLLDRLLRSEIATSFA